MENCQRSRRSFVDHRRKSLTFNNIFIDDTESNTERPKHSIKSYLESLQRENEEWKNVLKEKKVKYKDCENQCKSVSLTITEADVEKYFTSKDKEFLYSKPNYLNMVGLVRKYTDAINYVNKYKSDIIDYYEKAYNELEIDKKVLIEEMCARDLCEICNIKNCQRQEHKFVL